MKTQILPETAIDAAIALLKKGEVIAFPTETVYGIGAIEKAAEKIYRIKGRPQEKLLTAHIATFGQAKTVTSNLPKSFYRLAEVFLPGPLALVVSRGDTTIAIRMPDHKVALALIEKLGEPLFATSANLSGKPSATSAEEVLADLDGKIAAVIDGGQAPLGVASTVLDLISFDRPKILRPGTITKDQIQAVLDTEIL